MLITLDQWKRTKLQWLQDPSEINGDNLNNVRREASRHFGNKKNVHNIRDVRQIEVHTAEPLVPGPSRLEVEIATAKLKKYKSPGSEQFRQN
jgi:hypothetical protein